MAGHVRSLLLLGKWQGNSAECPFSYQGPWSTSKQCSLSQTNDHRSACFAANAQPRVYLCVRSWNQSSRKCKSPCMNCTIGMLPPPSSVVAQSRGNGLGQRQRLTSNFFFLRAEVYYAQAFPWRARRQDIGILVPRFHLHLVPKLPCLQHRAPLCMRRKGLEAPQAS